MEASCNFNLQEERLILNMIWQGVKGKQRSEIQMKGNFQLSTGRGRGWIPGWNVVPIFEDRGTDTSKTN